MRIQDTRGSLPVTLLFSFALLVIVLSLLSLSMSSYRLTARNEFRAQARTIAESELEHLYYLFKDAYSGGVKAENMVANMAAKGLVDAASTPSTVRQPYLTTHRSQGWTIRRSLQRMAHFEGVDAESGDEGTTNYFEVRVEVVAPAGSPWSGQSVRYARQFSSCSSVVFQKCIFYQGDLEFAPGGDIEITGDIVANGSIYLGASPSGSLTLKGNVTYQKSFGFNTNPGADAIFGTADDSGLYTTYRKPDTPTGSNLTAPTFYYSQSQQLKEASNASNFLGGLDAVALQGANPDLFPTVNDVYRSLIVPPPSAGNTNEYSSPASLTDALATSAQRSYNAAGIIITVEPSGTVSIKDNSTGADMTADLSPSITKKATDVYDMREGRNVTITEIDVGKLKDSLAGKSFNGLVYVNLKKGTASSPSAVRLINGAELPKSGADGKGGFSLVTNGGLYVKGDYNTTTLSDGTAAKSMLMADAMTVLSADWNDANAANTDVTSRKATQDLTINTAIMVGSTPASATEFSGGAQNLVRFLEDWSSETLAGGGTKDHTVTFKGSFGRLFDSKMFCRPFQQPGTVYIQPKTRRYDFDSGLRKNDGPPGSVKKLRTARGRFYQW
ncbi:MAG: hypothetical protein QM691_17180 [Opitutaceae bacterium]